jgi:hypothetical protein
VSEQQKPAAPPPPPEPTPKPRETVARTSGEALPIQQQNEWSSATGPGPHTHVGPDDPARGTVYLPGLISDEFGVSQPIAVQHIELGMVKIDGEAYQGKDKMNIPVELIDGKTISVEGRDRSFRVRYRQADHRS